MKNLKIIVLILLINIFLCQSDQCTQLINQFECEAKGDCEWGEPLINEEEKMKCISRNQCDQINGTLFRDYQCTELDGCKLIPGQCVPKEMDCSVVEDCLSYSECKIIDCVCDDMDQAVKVCSQKNPDRSCGAGSCLSWRTYYQQCVDTCNYKCQKRCTQNTEFKADYCSELGSDSCDTQDLVQKDQKKYMHRFLPTKI